MKGKSLPAILCGVYTLEFARTIQKHVSTAYQGPLSRKRACGADRVYSELRTFRIYLFRGIYNTEINTVAIKLNTILEDYLTCIN